MLKMNLANLQLFAHKKGGGSTSNGRDSQAKRLGAKAADGQTVSGGSTLPSTLRHTSIQVSMLVVEAMTHFLLKLKVWYVLSVKDAIKNKYRFTQSLNKILELYHKKLLDCSRSFLTVKKTGFERACL